MCTDWCGCRAVRRGGPLGAFVAGFKGAAGKAVHAAMGTPGATLWHRNYWDVIVPDQRALANIRRYIRDNPRNAHAVEDPGKPRFLGNRDLLEGPTVGFLASRGAPGPHGRLQVQRNEAIMSSFLSPMERALFMAGLYHDRPMIWVKPWGLVEGTDDPAVRRALKAGRLAILSPFDDALEGPSTRRALWCNLYIVRHATRLIVGHLATGGQLDCVLTEADPDKKISRL